MAQKITILVVDDEAKIVEVVKSYLENSGYRVECAFSGAQALQLFDACAPALVILDLMLPDMSGEDVCRVIRQKSKTPIIMLTAKVEEENIIGGLALGADDYITKPFSPRQLMARVEAVLRRTIDEPTAAAAGDFAYNDGELTIDDLRHEVRKQGKPVPLTPNEYKILLTMAKYPIRAFTRDELITFALGDEFNGFDRVIDTHIKNIRQKLGDDIKSPEYIITVHGTGYKFGRE